MWVCCIQGRTPTTLLYKNIICFFSCFSLLPKTNGSSTSELEMAEMCIHRVTVWCFCGISLPFCFFLPGQNSFLVYIIFWAPMQSLWSHVHMWTRLLSSMLPMQPMWHFRSGNTRVLFTSGNKWTSCFATHTAHVVLSYLP